MFSVLPESSATNYSCPTWFYYSNTTQRCECGFQTKWILCDQHTTQVLLKSGYCVTYSGQEGLFYGGECQFSYKFNKTNRLFSQLSPDPYLLEEMMCSPYNRKDFYCGNCIDGYGPGVYTLEEKCVNCSKFSMITVICLYLLVELFPILLFFVLMMVFRFDVIAGPMPTYVVFCQGVSIALMDLPTIAYDTIHLHTPAYLGSVFLMIIEFWNFNFLKFVIPQFCISGKLNRLHIIFLNSTSTFFQLLLVILFIILIDLHSRQNKVIRCILKPLSIVPKMKRVTTDAVIHTLASFLFLSSTKSLFLFFSISQYKVVYSSIDSSVLKKVLYVDPSIEYLSHTHIILFLFALVQCTLVVFFPSLLLFFYPTRVYRWISQFLSARKRLAITTFVEALNHCFKDGLNGTVDYRACAGILLFGLPMLGIWVKIFDLNFHQYSHIMIYCFVASFLSLFVSYSRPFKSTVGNLSASFYGILFGMLDLVVYLCLEDPRTSSETLGLMAAPLLLSSQVPVLLWALYKVVLYITKRFSDRE